METESERQGKKRHVNSSTNSFDASQEISVQIFDFDRTISREHTFSKKRLEKFISYEEGEQQLIQDYRSSTVSSIDSHVSTRHEEKKEPYSLQPSVANSNFHRKKPCNIAIDTSFALRSQQSTTTLEDYLALRFSTQEIYQAGKEDAQFGLIEGQKGSQNVKNGIPLKHDSFENIACIATYHNNPSYIAGYVSILLGKELIWKESIGSRTGKYNLPGPEIGINIYEVEGCSRVFCISYIPEIGDRFGKCLKRLAGKNNQINFLQYLLIEKEYISEATPLHFFDDDSDNIDQVSDLNINITSNLVDGHNNNIFTVTYSEVHHTRLIITEKNSNKIKNRKGNSTEKKISKRQKDDYATNGQKNQNIEEDLNEDGGKTQTNEVTSNMKFKSTSLNDDDHNNPGIFRLILGGLAAATAAAGAISLMK